MSKNNRRNTKSTSKTPNSNRSNKNVTPTNKNDDIPVKGQLNAKGWKNNPNYYFKDANQAEVMSRIQMNAFGAVTQMLPYSTQWNNKYMPSVHALYLNPSPGVTSSYYAAGTNRVKGINRAAQKLWYILTAKSGRSAGYTKSECAKLILAFGEIISNYEFIRRVFGISYIYSQRNRALPTMLWQAMRVDPDDFRQNAAVYLKRMNSLMAVMNQLPIMGNIAYFSKCQDLYQRIWMDAPSEMAQLWVFAPSTTWILEEDDGFIGGSYLRTVDMCCIHEDDNRTIANGVTDKRNVLLINTVLRPLGDYIDIFEDQINALLFSSNFSQVYADLLRAFDSGTLTRWSFDYIDEKYQMPPEYSESMLWQIHNATMARGWNSVTRQDYHTAFQPSDYLESIKNGTPLNDVYDFANADVLIYNPVLNSYYHKYNKSDLEFGKTIIDFPTDNPSVEERIEYTRYIISHNSDDVDDTMLPSNVSTAADAYVKFNYELPDHWIEFNRVLFTENDTSWFDTYDGRFCYGGTGIDNPGTSLNSAAATTKFHLYPLLPIPTRINSNANAIVNEIKGEVNAWAKMGAEWFHSINDMIYVDLYDIR